MGFKEFLSENQTRKRPTVFLAKQGKPALKLDDLPDDAIDGDSAIVAWHGGVGIARFDTKWSIWHEYPFKKEWDALVELNLVRPHPAKKSGWMMSHEKITRI